MLAGRLQSNILRGDPMHDNDQIRLFHDESLAGYLDAGQRSASSVIEPVTEQQFLATSSDTLVGQVVEELSAARLAPHMDHMQRQQALA